MNRILKNLNVVVFSAIAFCSFFLVQAIAQETKQAPQLPAGMTGANSDDPRSKLTPGLYDAGEAAFGIKHLTLVKKPDVFDLGVDPNGPNVSKALTALGIPAEMHDKLPAAMKMANAGLALANSDLAFQGDHLFLGNFYGINIYNIADPSKPKLVTTLLCPGGQGDVSVYKNLMFMSVEMPNGRLDCGEQSFPGPKPGATPGLPAAERIAFAA